MSQVHSVTHVPVHSLLSRSCCCSWRRGVAGGWTTRWDGSRQTEPFPAGVREGTPSRQRRLERDSDKDRGAAWSHCRSLVTSSFTLELDRLTLRKPTDLRSSSRIPSAFL